MSPSRGLRVLWLSPPSHTHKFARHYLSWASDVARPSNTVQSYVSTSNDPYLNLSIEHFLLQTTPPNSKILFLYTNRPCVIIGRNQNPWLEVNLSLLNPGRNTQEIGKEAEAPSIGAVDLVRRRSGGGTVFHDEGNVNWSVICPSEDFTRDKHAEMVVRALRGLGVDRARVNERHDIVLDQGWQTHMVDANDTHVTPYTVNDLAGPRPLKVSGSAYKLTKGRALHHGTCLLKSPNLHIIPQYLHSPAKPYIKARGVESVSSPVGNIGIKNAAFEHAVQKEFSKAYTLPSGHCAAITVGEELLEVSGIWEGFHDLKACKPILSAVSRAANVLKNLDWTYLQTPQFLFSSYPTEEDPRPRPPLFNHAPHSTRVMLRARYGAIQEFNLSISNEIRATQAQVDKVHKILERRNIHEIQDWSELLKQLHASDDTAHLPKLAERLAQMFPSAPQSNPPTCHT